MRKINLSGVERRKALRQEVMKGVEEIRRGRGIVYNSAEELTESVIEHGKRRKAKK
jgi:hypothetical protein